MKNTIMISRRIHLKNLNKEHKKYIEYMFNIRRSIWNKLHEYCRDDEKTLLEERYVYDYLKVKELCKGKYRHIPEWLDKTDLHFKTIRTIVTDYFITWQRHFNGLARPPKFKSKKRDKPSFSVGDTGTKIIKGGISIPGFNEWYKKEYDVYLNDSPKTRIPLSLSKKDYMRFNGLEPNKITFTREYDNRYYINLSFTKIEVKVIESENNSIGIDWGLRHYLTTSRALFYGQSIVNDKEKEKFYYHNLPSRYFKTYNRIIKLQRIKDHKRGFRHEDGPSKNFLRVRAKLSKAWRKLMNIKKDFIEKLTFSLLKNFRIIVIENLDLIEMRSNALVKRIRRMMDHNSFFMFKQRLIQKSEKFTAEIILADKDFPSSQTCHICGNKNKMKFGDNMYVCKKCGLKTERDINASKVLELYGLNEKGYL